MVNISDATCATHWDATRFTTCCDDNGNTSGGCGFVDTVYVTGTIAFSGCFNHDDQVTVTLGITIFNIDLLSKEHKLLGA